jgi:hypothetical protein
MLKKIRNFLLRRWAHHLMVSVEMTGETEVSAVVTVMVAPEKKHPSETILISRQNVFGEIQGKVFEE